MNELFETSKLKFILLIEMKQETKREKKKRIERLFIEIKQQKKNSKDFC